MNKGKIKATVIKCIAALLCCIIVILGCNSIADRVCKTKVSVAEANAGGSKEDDPFADLFAEFDDTGTGDEGMADQGAAAGTDAAVPADASADAADAGTDAAAPSADASNTGTAAPASSGSSSSSASPASPKAITLAAGLTSSNKEDILKFYQLAAAKNESKTFHQSMTMTSLDGGSGLVGGAISAFEPIAKNALAKNSTDNQGVPGKPEAIQPSDWVKAMAKSDGTYTTIVVQVANQTDGANGKVNEGPVGRSIGVLDGVQRAIDDLNGVTADFSNAQFALKYTNAYIKVKIKNSTGDFVQNSCEWHHTVGIVMDDLKVKVVGIPAHLQGASGGVEYSIKY